jgi:tetratricopeptide (TPR) repeat protein
VAERRAMPIAATKAVQPVRRWAFKFLERAFAALDQEKHDAAFAALRDMQQKDRRLNPHERALMWQTYAYVYSATDAYPDAIASFEKALVGDALPDAAMQNVRYNLAQLYLVADRHDDAIRTFLAWFERETSPPPQAHFMLAMAYVQNEQKDEALPHAREAIATAGEPREPWLQLLASLLIEQQGCEEALPVMEQLAVRFPKKTYYDQLSALYSQLGRSQQALGAMELAYLQGLLTEPRDVKMLAQLYLYNQIPYKAATVLRQAIEVGVVGDDAEAWTLLGTSLLVAKERDEAVEPLERAARLGGSGDGFLQLGRVLLAGGQWGAARSSLEAALRKGGLKDPASAHLLLGIANVNEERWDAARSAFEAARTHPATKPLADQWLANLESQEKTGGATHEAGDNSHS